MSRPLCFVLMPFGQKLDAAGVTINFDAMYTDVIAPAIAEAGMEPLRADEERIDGIIHKSMFERLLLCTFAVADLTTANANVFYELGIRHAVRPGSTVLLYAGTSRLPFDVAPLRAMRYTIAADGTPDKPEVVRTQLVERLGETYHRVRTTNTVVDSPIFTLIKDFPAVVEHIDPAQIESFQQRVQSVSEIKEQLLDTRGKGIEAIHAIEQQLEPIANQEPQTLLDLFFAYRSAKAWKEMIRLAENMPASLANTVTVREQLAWALNWNGQSERAERVLQDLLERRGPSSETYGLLGRVYKDRWKAALRAGQHVRAQGLLDQAINAYLHGFETDWRDAYPGINACTLMEIRMPPDARREVLLPVVAYAVERKIASGKPNYWDYATLLELAVLARDEQRAMETLGRVLTMVHESWWPESTADNLQLVREARESREDPVPWMQYIEDTLRSACNK